MARSKDHWMKLYTGDVLADEQLKSCSLAARGFFLYLLSLMHRSVRRGYLCQANGQPWTLDQLARMTGCSTQEAAHLRQELLTSGVFSATDDGKEILYSRRMVRETDISEKKAENGRKGGFATAKSAAKVQQTVQQTPQQTSRSSSSSVVSFTSEKEKELNDAPVGAGVQGEGEFATAKSQQNDGLSPGDLGSLWVFHRQGRGRESPVEASQTFAEMIGMGAPAVAIRDEILSKPPKRDRSEFLWQFKARLMAAARIAVKKTPEQERVERLAAEREYAKRLRAEREAKGR